MQKGKIVIKPITECRACHSKNLEVFLDLGKQYLADFRSDDKKTPAYPLVAALCADCKLVQLMHTTPQAEMYHERYGFKSGISATISADLDNAVSHAFQYINDPHNWLDIASNDGTLLSYVPSDVYRVGVDPVAFLCSEAEEHADDIINDYFSEAVAEVLHSKNLDGFDVVTSISCFYDMPEPERFVQDVKSILAPKGIWLIQQNYLLTTMELSAIDNFCHEHLEYYTLFSLERLLERFGLEVNEVQLSPINGGSIRTIVSNKDSYEIDESVYRQRLVESHYGVQEIVTYQEFAEQAITKLDKLYQLVKSLKADGKSICILAASTRGATIWQSAGIDHRLVDYAVERNPAKVGRMFTSIGVPIISEAEAHIRKPDYLIVGPWFYGDEIMEREKAYLEAGSSFILPLPEVKIIGGVHEPASHLVADLPSAV